MGAQVRLVDRPGTVAQLHAADLIGDLSPSGEVIDVVICRPSDAAVVLGSRQRPELLDATACEQAGLSVTGRRSGGGAVVIEPDSIVWIDVVMPAAFVPNDVRESMVRIGEHWAVALSQWFGHDADRDPSRVVMVHRGGMVQNAWSDLVCFAGHGPGEVLVGDAKLVGLSQRRTRRGARFQGMFHRAPLSTDVPSLFAGVTPGSPIPPVATLPDVEPALIASSLAESLDDT